MVLFRRDLAHRGHARVELAADVDEVEVGGGRDGDVCAGDEEEDGAVRVHVYEHGDVAAAQADGLHVHVLLDDGDPLGGPGLCRAERRLDLLPGHDDRVREDADRDDHVQHDVAHSAVAEEEGDRLQDVRGPPRGAEERCVALDRRHEVAVDRADAAPRAEAVVRVDGRGLAAGVVHVLAEHGVRDLAAHVDDADVAGLESGRPRLRRRRWALHDDDGGGGREEEALEGGDGLLHARETLGERADAEVAADGDVRGAQHDAYRLMRCGCGRRGHAQTRSNVRTALFFLKFVNSFTKPVPDLLLCACFPILIRHDRILWVVEAYVHI